MLQAEQNLVLGCGQMKEPRGTTSLSALPPFRCSVALLASWILTMLSYGQTAHDPIWYCESRDKAGVGVSEKIQN